MENRTVRIQTIVAEVSRPHGDARPLRDKESGSYTVTYHDGTWTCECPDHHYRGRDCKHIKIVQIGMNIDNPRPPAQEIPQ